MKKIMIMMSLLFIGCTGTNTEKTIKWIEMSKKPIICRVSAQYLFTNDIEYTLFNADGKIYFTGRVKLSLPDTIKAQKEVGE